MKNCRGNALIAGLLVTACLLTVGGLVAWGAGAFSGEDAPMTAPRTDGDAQGRMSLPEGHPPIGNLTRSPGPVRMDSPSGACPATGAAADAAQESGCSGCPSETASHAAAKAAPGDSCCPEPVKKKTCAGDACSGDETCDPAGSCEGGGCQGACEKSAEN